MIQSQNMRYFLPVVVACCLSIVAHIRTDFSQDAIRAPIEESGGVISIPILNQTFRFLGSGRQSFAFLGEDGQTVLKFFNKKYFEMPWYLSFLWDKSKERQKRAQRAFFYKHSYLIAAKFLKDQTGIVYLHSSKTQGLPSVCLTDRASREFFVDLNEVPFVLQKRADPLYAALGNIYKAGGKEALLSVLDDFLEMVQLRISFGIADRDHDVEHNFGFLDGKVLQLDPGRLVFFDFSDKRRVSHEWWSSTHALRKWLSVEYPDLVREFDSRLLHIKNRAD